MALITNLGKTLDRIIAAKPASLMNEASRYADKIYRLANDPSPQAKLTLMEFLDDMASLSRLYPGTFNPRELTMTRADVVDMDTFYKYALQVAARHKLATLYNPTIGERIEWLSDNGFVQDPWHPSKYEMYARDGSGKTGYTIHLPELVDRQVPDQFFSNHLDILNREYAPDAFNLLLKSINHSYEGMAFSPTEGALAPHQIFGAMKFSDPDFALRKLYLYDIDAIRPFVPRSFYGFMGSSPLVTEILSHPNFPRTNASSLETWNMRLDHINPIPYKLLPKYDTAGNLVEYVVPRRIKQVGNTGFGYPEVYGDEIINNIFANNDGILFSRIDPAVWMGTEATPGPGRILNLPIDNGTIPLNILVTHKKGGRLIPRKKR